MPVVYRAMTRDGDGKPCVGSTARTLGVRLPPDRYADVRPDENGYVGPESGGMSVARGWRDLPTHRIPRRLRHKMPDARGNYDEDSCFRMGDGPFEQSQVSEKLILVPDEADIGDRVVHGVITPAYVVALTSYQSALTETRERWVIAEE